MPPKEIKVTNPDPSNKFYCQPCCKVFDKTCFEMHMNTMNHQRRLITKWFIAQMKLMDFCERHFNIQQYHEYLNNWNWSTRKCIENKCLEMIDSKEEKCLVRCLLCRNKRGGKLAGASLYKFQLEDMTTEEINEQKYQHAKLTKKTASAEKKIAKLEKIERRIYKKKPTIRGRRVDRIDRKF
jgi:hypothetical protein